MKRLLCNVSRYLISQPAGGHEPANKLKAAVICKFLELPSAAYILRKLPSRFISSSLNPALRKMSRLSLRSMISSLVVFVMPSRLLQEIQGWEITFQSHHRHRVVDSCHI